LTIIGADEIQPILSDAESTREIDENQKVDSVSFKNKNDYEIEDTCIEDKNACVLEDITDVTRKRRTETEIQQHNQNGDSLEDIPYTYRLSRHFMKDKRQ
jgi:hypothetical protein